MDMQLLYIKCRHVVFYSQVPRASKSLPIVTLGNTEGSSSHSKLAATPEEMAERKVLDLKRWYVSD